MTGGEPETAVSATLQKMTSIKNPHKHYFYFFIFCLIKSQTSDSFVTHFDGHFAYLKTLDFSFKFRGLTEETVLAQTNAVNM